MHILHKQDTDQSIIDAISISGYVISKTLEHVCMFWYIAWETAYGFWMQQSKIFSSTIDWMGVR